MEYMREFEEAQEGGESYIWTRGGEEDAGKMRLRVGSRRESGGKKQLSAWRTNERERRHMQEKLYL